MRKEEEVDGFFIIAPSVLISNLHSHLHRYLWMTVCAGVEIKWHFIWLFNESQNYSFGPVIVAAGSRYNQCTCPFSSLVFGTIIAVKKKRCLTTKSSSLSSWRLWRRKTDCAAPRHFNGWISILCFSCSCLKQNLLVKFAACLDQFEIPFKLEAWHRFVYTIMHIWAIFKTYPEGKQWH